jgi:drug/metabolite transporter (DMT)-like permease
MWKILILLSVLFTCITDIIDKYSSKYNVNVMVSSFIRVTMYNIIIIPVEYILGTHIHYYFDPIIVLLGLFNAISSISYSVLLRNVSINSISVITTAIPIIFLFIDHILGNQFTSLQIISLFGLTIGGMVFVADDRLSFDWKVILSFITIMFCYGSELYYARWISETHHLKVIDPVAAMWINTSIILAIMIIVSGKVKEFFTSDTINYMKIACLSKPFDAMSSAVWCLGFLMVSTSEYSSMNVFLSPIMLFLTWVTQKVLKYDLGEKMDNKAMWRKIIGVSIIMMSSLYI